VSTAADNSRCVRTGELLLDLKRIDDFCLSNRVIVFNAEDLEQAAPRSSRDSKPSVVGRLLATEMHAA